MPKMYQIHEHDLIELSRDCALLCDEMSHELHARQKVMVRRIKRLLSDVLWNYGPHESSEIIPSEGDEESPEADK